jgi:hypothetical protein
MSTRDFSRTRSPASRTIDNDAPGKLRLEWLAAIFDLAEQSIERHQARGGYRVVTECVTPEKLYKLVNGTLGVSDAVQPYGGYLKRASTNLSGADWERFYDVVLRVFKEFKKHTEETEYVEKTNEVLAAHGSAWQLTSQGNLERVVPVEVQTAVHLAFEELDDPKYQAAKELFALAKAAFDARPRRDRDAGANAFDGLESVVKTRFNEPSKTFGAVIDRYRARVDDEILAVLKKNRSCAS